MQKSWTNYLYKRTGEYYGKKNKLHKGNVVQNHEIDQLKMNHLKIFKEFEFWSWVIFNMSIFETVENDKEFIPI